MASASTITRPCDPRRRLHDLVRPHHALFVGQRSGSCFVRPATAHQALSERFEPAAEGVSEHVRRCSLVATTSAAPGTRGHPAAAAQRSAITTVHADVLSNDLFILQALRRIGPLTVLSQVGTLSIDARLATPGRCQRAATGVANPPPLLGATLGTLLPDWCSDLGRSKGGGFQPSSGRRGGKPPAVAVRIGDSVFALSGNHSRKSCSMAARYGETPVVEQGTADYCAGCAFERRARCSRLPTALLGIVEAADFENRADELRDPEATREHCHRDR